MASEYVNETKDLITLNLRTCPFCGGTPYVSEESVGDDGLDDVWRIYCDGCPAMMEAERTAEGLEQIVEAWNRGQ